MSKPKRTSLHGIQYLSFVRDAGGGGGEGFCVVLVKVCHWDTEILTLSATHTLQLILWEYDPRALKCFAFAGLDQQGLLNVTSDALFCVLQVWQDFIRVAFRMKTWTVDEGLGIKR